MIVLASIPLKPVYCLPGGTRRTIQQSNETTPQTTTSKTTTELTQHVSYTVSLLIKENHFKLITGLFNRIAL